MTSNGSESSAVTFSRRIRLRDRAGCIVTRLPNALIASHLIPKRMGSHGAKAVVTRFSGGQTAFGTHKFDPRIGILLVSALDALVDRYQLGFYHVTGNTYTLHNFHAKDPDLTVIAVVGYPLSGMLYLPFTFTRRHHAGDAPLPPDCVFNWHYLQCVVRAFATPQYHNITFFVHPFKTAYNDSDDEYTDNDETEPPYPSYCFDRYLEEQEKRQMALERHEEVARWSSGISSGA